jgi:LCP family protein required for cell wall assembly
MSRRPLLSLLASLALVAASCSNAGESPFPARPTADSATSTSQPTTTTTEDPFFVDQAPEPLEGVIESFYAYARGEATTAPPMPAPVLAAITPGEVETPMAGTASLGVFKETQIAVVTMASDTFLAVADAAGWRIVGGAWPSLSVPVYFGDAPRHVAVVGSDARPGEQADATRADSIHFVSLDGAGGGAVVGLPRDSYVPVPGFGRRKITTSLSLGGPDTMMAAFTDLTGLPLEGYVLTGFAGFEALVGTVIGGVTVNVPFNINDRWAHVSLGAGEQLLDGAQALGFARARKTIPGGDLTRSEHQGVILISAAKAVKAMGFRALPAMLEVSEPYLVTNLSPEQIFTFSAMAIAANLDTVVNDVAPGRPGVAGGASVVFLSDSVSQLWADLADGRIDG